jgi:HJR/Mrr/RecB family endonuclease
VGTLVAVYCENKKRFFPCAQKVQLKTEGVRRVLASRYRYCLGADYFYVPSQHPDLEESDRLCWVRDRSVFDFDRLNEIAQRGELEEHDVRIGDTYVLRRREVGGKFIEVDTFVPDTLFDEISKNPDALSLVTPGDFENLCAEVFVRRGFEVDLFRKSKDGGIDFLAVKSEELSEPQIFAVQCKQPEKTSKGYRTLGRPIIQQVYGAAKAWNLDGAIAISGASYSREAKQFADLKPNEMNVHGKADLLVWIRKYRWNDDE